jgi:hypothetical protein
LLSPPEEQKLKVSKSFQSRSQSIAPLAQFKSFGTIDYTFKLGVEITQANSRPNG